MPSSVAASVRYRSRPRNACSGLRLQPLAVPTEVQGPQPLARLPMIALADKDLTSVPAEALPLAAVAPAHNNTPAGQRANREVLKAQNLLDDRTLRRRRHVASVTRRAARRDAGRRCVGKQVRPDAARERVLARSRSSRCCAGSPKRSRNARRRESGSDSADRGSRMLEIGRDRNSGERAAYRDGAVAFGSGAAAERGGFQLVIAP